MNNHSMMPHRLTLTEIENAYRIIDPVFLNTPQYECEQLSEMLGCQLVLKIETLNPIRSFKGRGADWLLHQSTAPHLICASAGNFGQAIAYSCRKKRIKCTVYASNHANPLKVERMRGFGAEVILFGDDFDTAKQEAKRVAREKNIRFVEDSNDIETLAGAGTMALELLGLHHPLDALLIPLGNGAMLNGIARVMKERSPYLKIVAVQAAGAPAMIESWQHKKVVIHERTNTIADGIAVRVPVAQALTDMQGLVDDAYLVKEETILQAMKILHAQAGVVSEPSGAVGIAAILENQPLFAGKRVGAIICGSNLTEEQIKNWL
ncbi:MAG: threonine/serine dehydratase [Cytophagales bacterium]